MAGNTFGKVFKLTTHGESHGVGLGGIIDGCPAGLSISIDQIQLALNKRKPGQSDLTTPRKEDDEVKLLSGVFEGVTTGAPIAFFIENQTQRHKDYSIIKQTYRPSHADYTWETKYGLRDYRGGGRTSARETASRVVGGSIAAQFLAKKGISVTTYVSQVGKVVLKKSHDLDFTLIEQNKVRCPNEAISKEMEDLILAVKRKGDSVGGVVTCMIHNVPVGLGEPVFDKLHADLGKAMLSINAVKGFEIGSGFDSASMLGSEHNDPFVKKEEKLGTVTNNSGGIQGGISNGEPIVFKVAFKPVATIMQKQHSFDKEGNEIEIPPKGRHDPCVVPRAVAIVEGMAALVIADHLLRSRTDKIDI